MTYYRETRNSVTGTTIIVGHGDDLGLDTTPEGGGPWYTVCDTHSTLCSHTTLALARSWAGGDGPLMWCEDCQAVQAERERAARRAAFEAEQAAAWAKHDANVRAINEAVRAWVTNVTS